MDKEFGIEIVKGAPEVFSKEQINGICLNTPSALVKKRKGTGGREFSYVDTPFVIQKLNSLFGFAWDFEVLAESSLEESLASGCVRVKGKLTVKDFKGNFITKTNYGSQPILYAKGKPHTVENMAMEVGDLYKASASDCLKKCASMFGIALDVYSGEFDTKIEGEYESGSIEKKDHTKNAKSEVSDTSPQINQGQIRLFYLVKNKLKISDDTVKDILSKAYGVEKVSQLTMRAFNNFLDEIDPEMKFHSHK